MKSVLILGLILAVARFPVLGQGVNPFPREIIATEKLVDWTFRDGVAGWSATHDCAITAENGALKIQSSGNDPYLATPAVNITGPLLARLRLKSATAGKGQLFWMTSQSPSPQEARSEHFVMIHDGQFHEYSVALPAQGTITGLRFDPGEAPGAIELEKFELVRLTLHPLEIQSATVRGHVAEVMLTNHAGDNLECRVSGQRFEIGGNDSRKITVRLPGKAPFESRELEIAAKGYPSLRRSVFCADAERTARWMVLKSGTLAVRVAEDGTGARIELNGKLVGFLAPLLTINKTLPRLKAIKDAEGLRLSGAGTELRMSVRGEEISVAIRSELAGEGPVLRALGTLEQGLFAGVEYLAKGESSSSTLDIETAEHIRFAPDPLKVTMPLMAFVTERAATAMTWQDMTLQPVFATPNFLDGAVGHRAALRGKDIKACIRVTEPGPIEETILWAVRKHGLPALPRAPRSEPEQLDFCLKTLSGPPLKTDAGWGHCAEEGWERHPFADQASTLWRLTGHAPALPQLVPGGSHIRNEAIYFVTGRAKEWLRLREAQARAIISEQQPDGSFRYHGKFQRGHFEDTASGYCASRAQELLETARLLGNRDALQAGIRALEFMKHFHDPRGAQTWECPLHTPDILASAYLVEAYLLGYELTAKTEYLERARSWAITGLPFVYQWSDRPIMAYATTPVFGATQWRAPNWIGLPVQWCGYDYAYALARLAPLDHTLDWTLIAKGILVAAEQMQYPDGPYAGCVPDSFNLAEQHRNGPSINPCAMVSLRLVLEGKLDGLACAVVNGRRVVAPFPIALRNGQAEIQGREGVTYQAVIDGRDVLEIHSRGRDLLP